MDLNATFYNCTRGTFHSHECEGDCGEYELSDTDRELYYERKRWEMLGLPFEGVPSVLKGGPFNGIMVDPLEVLLRIQALCELLISKGLVDRSEMDDALTAYVLKRMTTLREGIEKERAKQRLTVAKSKLLGPHGEILN